MSKNYSILGRGFYLVRTQAGFNQALKHAAEGLKLYEHSNFPVVYPAVVLLERTYNGYWALYAKVWSVREWRDFVTGVENKINRSDELHVQSIGIE